MNFNVISEYSLDFLHRLLMPEAEMHRRKMNMHEFHSASAAPSCCLRPLLLCIQQEHIYRAARTLFTSCSNSGN